MECDGADELDDGEAEHDRGQPAQEEGQLPALPGRVEHEAWIGDRAEQAHQRHDGAATMVAPSTECTGPDGAGGRGARQAGRQRSAPGRPCGLAGIAQHADALDLDLDHVTVAQEALRLAPDSDPGRRAGHDHVARFERERPRRVGDDLGHAEDHVAGVPVLERLARHGGAHAEGLWVGDLVARHQPRTERAERVEALAADPLAIAELEVARGDVVAAGVAEHVVERGCLGDLARPAPDDDSQLRLVVDL